MNLNSLGFPPSRAANGRHRFFQISLAGVFLIVCLAPFAHAATLSGRVSNQATRDLLPGAMVSVPLLEIVAEKMLSP